MRSMEGPAKDTGKGFTGLNGRFSFGWSKNHPFLKPNTQSMGVSRGPFSMIWAPNSPLAPIVKIILGHFDTSEFLPLFLGLSRNHGGTHKTGGVPLEFLFKLSPQKVVHRGKDKLGGNSEERTLPMARCA